MNKKSSEFKTPSDLLEEALTNPLREKYGLNILFGDEAKNPSVKKWNQWCGAEQQSDEDVKVFFNKRKDAFTNYGFAVGHNGLVALDFDWAWMYRRAKDKGLSCIEDTFIAKTPNGGYRVLLFCQNYNKNNSKYKNTLRFEIFGGKHYAACYGEAAREDGSIGEYKVIYEEQIKKLDPLGELETFLEDTLKAYDFLTYPCIASFFEGHKKRVRLTHEQRLAIANLMLQKGISIDEAQRFFMMSQNYDEAVSRQQCEYTQAKIEKEGLKPPTCDRLKTTFGYDGSRCSKCSRKKATKTKDKEEEVEKAIKWKIRTATKEELEKYILHIWEEQNPDEQATGEAKEDNAAGFDKEDSKTFSTIAEDLVDGKHLTKEQEAKVRKRLPRYWKQYLKADLFDVEVLLTEYAQSDADKPKDLYYIDENGRKRINYEEVIENICQSFTFRVTRDTKTVYVYDNGIYREGDVDIEEYIEQLLGSDVNNRLVSELIGHIRRRYYTPRERFNEDKNYLPLQNGLLNLETLSLEDFDPEKIFTCKLPAEFDEKAGHAHYEDFFREVLYDEDVATMQEMFGYCLLPEHPAHKSFWLLGRGRNGKSQTGHLLTELLGAENCANVPLSQLDGEHRFAEARLFGKLANVVAEPGTKSQFSTPTFKAATGGDLLAGEEKGKQRVFLFNNFAKFIIYANRIPRIDDDTDAFWERVIVLDFPNQFIGSKAKKEHYKVLIKQDGLAGLLNWGLVGLKRLRENNWEFTGTKSQMKAKNNMRRQTQPIRAFLEDWTIFDSRHEILKELLYDAFKIYCEIHQILLPDEATFTREIKKIGKAKITRPTREEDGQTKRIYCWQGRRFSENAKVVASDEEGKKELISIEQILSCPTCLTCPSFSPLEYMGEREELETKEGSIPPYKAVENTPDRLDSLGRTKESSVASECDPPTSLLNNSSDCDRAEGKRRGETALSEVPKNIDKNVCDGCGKDTPTTECNGQLLCDECLSFSLCHKESSDKPKEFICVCGVAFATRGEMREHQAFCEVFQAEQSREAMLQMRKDGLEIKESVPIAEGGE
ncbi:MAG: hypothetical protein JJE19_05650 [Methanosarcinales archaeon]|nr:hypothetical protein [Methanosarcinales archaeon]